MTSKGAGPKDSVKSKHSSSGRPLENPYVPDKKISCHIPKNVHAAWKLTAALNDKPMVQLLIEALIKQYGGGEIIGVGTKKMSAERLKQAADIIGIEFDPAPKKKG